MDLSIILALPFAAVVAFVTVVGAVLIRRSRPRLIWPFGFSVLFVSPVFINTPTSSEFGLWILAIVVLAIWVAVGTILGAMLARLAFAAWRMLSRD